MIRHDLLELTPQALAALANVGFVKRAQKDAAAGLLPALERDPDGTVRALFDDGARTVLPPERTLQEADCSCAAARMCRHRVLLVLAYQAQAAAAAPVASGVAQAEGPADGWSPAQFDDAALAAAFAPSVLEQARRIVATRPVVGVLPWHGSEAPPTARLPMCSVRFFSRHALAHARCDCQQGSGCAHVVLGVWAFRSAGDVPAGTAETLVQLAPPGQAEAANATPAHPQGPDSPAGQAARSAVDGLLRQLWLDGASQPLLALAARCEAARAQVQALGWRWVDDALDELWQLLQAQQARSSRFDPLRLLAVQAELWARLQAAADAQRRAALGERPERPASLILGQGVPGEVALDHLRLVSLGANLWSDAQADGASVLLADPDTQTVTVLERRWPRAADASGAAPAPLAGRRVAGVPLHQFAASQIVTKAAKRRANGGIDIGAGARQTGVLPLSATAWSALAPPLKQPGAAALAAHLRALPPDFVQPRLAAVGAAGALHVVALDGMAVLDCHWDAAAQVLHACIGEPARSEDTEGAATPGLQLALPHRALAPHAADALARVLAGEWGALQAIAGQVELRAGVPCMQPLAVLTTERAVVLQLEPAAAQSLPVQTAPMPQTPLQHLVRETRELLAQWLRQGLRHQPGGLPARIEAQAQRLRAAGLPHCAAQLQALPPLLQGASREALVPLLGASTLLLQGVAQSARGD